MVRALPLTALTLCAAAALPASGQTLIQSFENGDITVPTNTQLEGTLASWSLSTIGVTDGSASFRATAQVVGATGGGAKNLIKWNLYENPAVLAAVKANPVIEFDVVAPDDDNPSDAFDGTKMTFATVSEIGGFTGYYGSDYVVTYGASSLHVVYTLPAEKIADLANPLNNWMIFSMGTNSQIGVAPTIYIDNVRVAAVPEPASLALLGLGGLALLGRRRA